MRSRARGGCAHWPWRKRDGDYWPDAHLPEHIAKAAGLESPSASDTSPSILKAMTRARVTGWLAWIVGAIFIGMGIIEVAVRLVSDDPIDLTAIAWWSLSLIGGGTLVLLGSFVIKPAGVGFALVAVGCLLGIVATAWTLLIPVLAMALVILSAIRASAQDAPPAD